MKNAESKKIECWGKKYQLAAGQRHPPLPSARSNGATLIRPMLSIQMHMSSLIRWAPLQNECIFRSPSASSSHDHIIRRYELMLVALDANPHRRAIACISRKAGSLSPLLIWVTTSMHIYTWTGMTAQQVTLTQKLCWCPLVSSAQNPISCRPCSKHS